jgi:hypothetical protein
MNRLFDLCVDLLEWMAEKIGISYQALNVWIFVVVWPLVTLGLIGVVIRQWLKIRTLCQ